MYSAAKSRAIASSARNRLREFALFDNGQRKRRRGANVREQAGGEDGAEYLVEGGSGNARQARGQATVAWGNKT